MQSKAESAGSGPALIAEKTLEACLALAQRAKQGCLIVCETKPISKQYYKDSNRDFCHPDLSPISIFDPDDRQGLEKLAAVDGALILDSSGAMLDYGATLLHSTSMRGHGKRHAFARGTSMAVKGVVCILHSEEDGHTRSFRDGFLVVDIAPDGKLKNMTRHRIAALLCNPLTATLAVSGVVTSILSLNPLPAIITISGSTILIRQGFLGLKKTIEG